VFGITMEPGRYSILMAPIRVIDFLCNTYADFGPSQ
jgi:hypothetical protein